MVIHPEQQPDEGLLLEIQLLVQPVDETKDEDDKYPSLIHSSAIFDRRCTADALTPR